MDPQQGPPQTDILIGQTVGNYLVTQKLGEGGMGSVYLAEHPTIGKKVALKVLHSEFCQNEEVANRFITEAKAVNAIGHPNIVDIVDYGVIQAGQRDRLVYFIMEYLSGITLSQVIRTQSPLPPERALTIALQVGDALAASHRCGIVHRDLKPDNIILLQRGRESDFVKLLDFGIAKLTGGDGLSSHRTRTGLVLGTPAYMSPEQCEGKANVDHRTDIYALGICLYEMLVGRVPFIGEGYGEILVQHLTARPIEPSRYRMMSPHVEMVVLKALEKRPEMRYPNMDEMMRAMADPVGFVESHGGISGFLQRQLMPSTTGALPPVRLTPGPMTPVPGLMSPVPGTLSPVPTTLGSAAGQVAGHRNRTGYFVAGGVVVALAAIAVIVVVTRNKSGGEGSPVAVGSGSDTAGSAVEPTHPGSAGATAPVGSAAPTGSATVQVGSGSAATAAPQVGSAGSATVAPPEPTVTKLTIHSKPPGAEIYLDALDTGKTTDATLELPRKTKSVTITLKLSHYDDLTLKNVALDKDEVTQDIALKEHHSGSHTGPVTHGPTGHGSGAQGSATGPKGPGNDTGLMRPDDL